MLGIASNAPGGIGVFEATILLALSSLPRNEVLTSLLLFRGCYYVVPFVTALAMLGLYEIVKRAGGASDSRDETRQSGPPEGTAGPSGQPRQDR
jgi:glycosyltransferase 2 family protein